MSTTARDKESTMTGNRIRGIDMGRINPLQWRSGDPSKSHVAAESIQGGVIIRVVIGGTSMGLGLTTAEADDLAKFIIECGIAERTGYEV